MLSERNEIEEMGMIFSTQVQLGQLWCAAELFVSQDVAAAKEAKVVLLFDPTCRKALLVPGRCHMLLSPTCTGLLSCGYLRPFSTDTWRGQDA